MDCDYDHGLFVIYDGRCAIPGSPSFSLCHIAAASWCGGACVSGRSCRLSRPTWATRRRPESQFSPPVLFAAW